MQKNHDSEHMNYLLPGSCNFLTNLSDKAFLGTNCVFEFHSHGFQFNQHSFPPAPVLKRVESNVAASFNAADNEVKIFFFPNVAIPFLVRPSVLLRFSLRSREAERRKERREK
jgi:hypothetical protein